MRDVLRKEEVQPSKSLHFLYNGKFGNFVLKFLASRPISVIFGAFLSTRLSTLGIKKYIENNHIDMSLYEERKFRSFNDFFTRRVKEGLRPFDKTPEALVSPCDGKLSVYKITEDLTFNVKGFDHTVESLLKSSELAEKFKGGTCLVFRLCVDDYHRYFFFDDCTREEYVHIKGKFHTVQPVALETRRVFCENAREYVLLHTEHFGDAVQMEVGAMMVGKIKNYLKYHGSAKGSSHLRGEEKGKFEFGGSTIIVLLRENAAELDEELWTNTQNGDETIVRCGERIGKAIYACHREES